MASAADSLRGELEPWLERARAFSGWDFRDLHRRAIDAEPPWDYAARARELAERAGSVLDLGTGGGERLAEIAAGLSAQVVATEYWPPNRRIAHERLAALGMEVLGADSERSLPFRPESFGLVLSRHEAFAPTHVAEVLAPGGTLLSQQVGHDNWPEWRTTFPGATRFENHDEHYPRELRALGFEVEMQFHRQLVAYPRAEFFYLVALSPWELERFDLDRDIEHWAAFFDANGNDQGELLVTETRYLLEARKRGR